MSISFKSSPKLFKLFVVILTLLSLPGSIFITQGNAFGGGSSSGGDWDTSDITAEDQEMRRRIENSSCPLPVKQYILDDEATSFTLEGTYIVARTSDGTPVYLTCASASFIETLVIRLFVLLFSLVGLALVFAIIRGSVLMMTSMGDAEKFQEGVKSIVVSISAVVGVLAFYTIFVFVAVDVLRIGKATERTEFNLFCGNKIIFDLTFERQTTANDPNDPCK